MPHNDQRLPVNRRERSANPLPCLLGSLPILDTAVFWIAYPCLLMSPDNSLTAACGNEEAFRGSPKFSRVLS
jgi:hypothetical protein